MERALYRPLLPLCCAQVRQERLAAGLAGLRLRWTLALLALHSKPSAVSLATAKNKNVVVITP
jgi:hypothetical protein